MPTWWPTARRCGAGILGQLGREVDYLPVPGGGATRAARLLADLL